MKQIVQKGYALDCHLFERGAIDLQPLLYGYSYMYQTMIRMLKRLTENQVTKFNYEAMCNNKL